MVLQGTDLLNEPYEDIGLRPMTDIGLWVSKKDYEKIVQILVPFDPLDPHIAGQVWREIKTNLGLRRCSRLLRIIGKSL